jgi:hypothetical protein
MHGHETYIPQNKQLAWFERRLPVLGLLKSSFVDYPTPRNLNYWWTFGGILTVFLVIQIVTGVVLTMHFSPTAGGAFDSVEHIMRNVNYGWLLRYVHANGASMFFLAVYIHIPLDSRRDPVPADDGNGLHGLRAAVGADELLGRDGHHQSVLSDSAGRRRSGDLAVGRLLGR